MHCAVQTQFKTLIDQHAGDRGLVSKWTVIVMGSFSQ